MSGVIELSNNSLPATSLNSMVIHILIQHMRVLNKIHGNHGANIKGDDESGKSGNPSTIGLWTSVVVFANLGLLSDLM
jgi:hypothetical protein